MNTLQLLNEGWQFQKKNGPTQSVSLPHDWLIQDVHNLYEDSVGTYTKTFQVESNLPKHFLRFLGVYMDCSVYVNDQHVGDWKFGYTSFELEITDYLTAGDNHLKVIVRHEPPNSRWYSGAGIYRNVYLVSTAETYIPYSGIYIVPQKNDDGTWTTLVDTEIMGNMEEVTVKHAIYVDGELLSEALHIAEPQLWDIDHPNLYELRTTLEKQGLPIHEETTVFGLREIAFDRDKGFFLNGKHLKINGVCQHHDLGALGAAFYPDALERQFVKLKAMGVNGLRTAHNPPDPYFMDLADRMGFVVVSELLDMWEKPKTSKDYARFFNAIDSRTGKPWHELDTVAWVKRDRNHPSLIMWSVGNEIYDTHGDPERATVVMKNLVQLVSAHDPFGNGHVTIGSNYLPWAGTQAVADTLPAPKLVGYNYAEYLYPDHHNQYPDWVIYGSETGSVVQSRGVYHFPLSQSVLADDDLQCSSLGNSATSWGAPSTQVAIDRDRHTPFSLGQFIWTGTDYLGEPTPYHTKNSYFGQIDTAGFEKDAFYIYQASWMNAADKPMVHVFPHWDFSPGQMIDVQVVSNCHRFELYLNDTLVSETSPVQLPYTPGRLTAKAYNGAGELVATHTQQSFGDTASLQLHEEVYGNLLFTTITAIDAAGATVANANNRVNVTVTNGQLLGLDSGDSTDWDQYQNNHSKRLFSGKLLAITTAGSTVEATLDSQDIPIRKIALTPTGVISPANTTITIHATTYPANATHTDLSWRVTDAAGIDTNIATWQVSTNGRELTLTAKGDGQLFVRCCAHNGKDHVSLISYLDFNLTGLGKAYMNPYELVSGGLYNRANLPMTNGNERGVATLRDGTSHVGFADLDFGEMGSDTLHLPIFAMVPEPFTFEIWEGMPDEGGERLLTPTYTRGTQWNTYRTETYQLPKKLTGITTLCIVVHRKIHLKGFWFDPPNKVQAQLPATSYSQIYGDSFTLTEEAVTDIGNNVTLVFEGMHMASEPTQITLRGRSSINNTIHLKYDNGLSQLLEWQASEDITTQTFAVRGQAREQVSFVFLPGSQFDFVSFQFS